MHIFLRFKLFKLLISVVSAMINLLITLFTVIKSMVDLNNKMNNVMKNLFIDMKWNEHRDIRHTLNIMTMKRWKKPITLKFVVF